MSGKTELLEYKEVYDRFVTEYFGLNPQGHVLQAWTNILYQRNNGEKNSQGEPLTLEDLIQSYTDYLIYWNRTFANLDEKFIPKDNKLMNPEEFISRRAYHNLWNSAITSRDLYLFGRTTEAYRDEKLNKFLENAPKIKPRTKKKNSN